MAPVFDLHYRINARDEIASVDAGWDRFAAANGATHLMTAGVVGRRLWDFIADAATVDLYKELVAGARRGRAIEFPFRCDAPDRRRLLEMQIGANGDPGTIEFRTRLLTEEERDPQPALDTAVPHTEKLLRRCSWCNRVAVDDSWVELETAIAHLRLFDAERPPGITHGLCDPCLARVSRQIR